MRLFMSVLFCTILASCSSSKKTQSSDSDQGEVIEFGEGGGFAGTVTTYKLFKSGQLFIKKPRENAFSELQPLDATETEQYFSTVETMQFKSMKCNQPENWYYFLEMDNDGGKTKLVWGSNSNEATQTLKLFCKNLLNVAKKQAALEKKPANQ